MMNYKQIAWRFATHIAAVAGALLPLLVSYDLRNAGEHPEKFLELTETGSFHPLRDLAGLTEGGRVSLQVGDRDFRNLFIIHANLINTGRSPILPSDFHENLTMEVTKPWEIVAVKQSDSSQVVMKWAKISNEKHEAIPTLLNPRDISSFTVYLTNESLSPVAVLDDKSEPKLKWHTRIVNLAGIHRPDKQSGVTNESNLSLFVFLSDWKLVFFSIASLANLAALLFLLHRGGFIHQKAVKPLILWTLGAASLSVSAAECASTYIFGDSIWSWGGEFFITQTALSARMFEPLFEANHWFNAPALILNSIAMLYLLNRAKPRGRKNRTAGAKDKELSVTP